MMKTIKKDKQNYPTIVQVTKGQLISKANCQAMNSSKKRTNEFVFTTYYATCLHSFFGRNWSEQKDISKLTDL